MMKSRVEAVLGLPGGLGGTSVQSCSLAGSGMGVRQLAYWHHDDVVDVPVESYRRLFVLRTRVGEHVFLGAMTLLSGLSV